MKTPPSLTVIAPIYLITSTEDCYECRQSQTVIALATYSIHEEDASEDEDSDEPFILVNVTEMPGEVLEHVKTVHPNYRMHPSRTAGFSYYANMCECGVNFGDHFLHKPGGAFFPEAEQDAARMTVVKLPLLGKFPFQAEWSQGIGGEIFEHAKRAG